LVDHIVFKQNGVTRMTTTKQWDKLNRLTNIVSTTNAVAVNRSAYDYNLASQRTRNTQADGSYWSYRYDTLGQVTNGHKYWSNAVPVAGHQFDYLYDDIGNRKSAWEGGDASGANLRRSDYTANALNQYTQRTVPGYAFDIGSANTNAYDSVNLQPVNRHGEYYWLEWTVTNTSAPVWLGLTNFAVLHSATNDLVASSVGHLFVPKTPETYTHDADGNLTNDGRFAYSWDGENRLTIMTANTAVGIKERLDFKYDAQSRRIRKRVWTNWDGAAGTLISLQQYVYDGWNLVAILGANNVVQQSFTWGLDQSGTEQGAGGVGGLLTMRVHTGPLAGTYFYCYDGNGNITALVNAADGSIAAQYEYGPFGQLLRATGPLAFVNPFRFSTKYQDDETGLYYYGYRYYNPNTGRWLSRDPKGERGGKNLYGFVRNAPISRTDYLGLIDSFCGFKLPKCGDKCKLGEYQLGDKGAEVKLTLPDVTPEKDEAANAAAKAAGDLDDSSDFFPFDPADFVASKMLDFQDVNDAFRSIKDAALNDKAWLWTRLTYRFCTKKNSYLIGPSYNDWSSPITTGWVKCSIGIDENVGWYWGKDDALKNAPACIQAHVKQELGQ
jgi:RHS repeat-associated protein